MAIVDQEVVVPRSGSQHKQPEVRDFYVGM